MLLYLVRMFDSDNDEEFLKIGVTGRNSLQDRFSFGSTKVMDSELPLSEKIEKIFSGCRYLSDCPYQVKEINSVTYKLDGDALLAEKELLEAVKPSRYWPKKSFSGRTECFKGDELVSFIVKAMKEDCEDKNGAAPSELMYKLKSIGIYAPDDIKKHLLVLERCRLT
jgi:hypothetical protein